MINPVAALGRGSLRWLQSMGHAAYFFGALMQHTPAALRRFGLVVAHGRPDELNASEDPEVRQFIRGEPDGPVRFHYPAPPLAEDFGVRP